MTKKLVLPSTVTSAGVLLLLFAQWWAGQTGYNNPDPAKRDANIGAGLLGFAAIAITLIGAGWLIFTLARALRRSN